MGGTASVSAPQYSAQQQPGLSPMQPQQQPGLSPQPIQPPQQPMQQPMQPTQQSLIQSQPLQRPTTLPAMPAPPSTVYPAYNSAPGQQAYTTGSVRQQFAHGGIPRTKAPRAHRLHTGPIHSNVAGRTDHLPVHVPNGSYVIPADIISALGEGNSMAGFKVAQSIFSMKGPYDQSTGSMPYGGGAMPYGQPAPHKAEGGETDAVPIVAAGGEYVIPPEDVTHIGGGSLDDGHKILDAFVKKMRKKTIRTLQSLPGPKKN